MKTLKKADYIIQVILLLVAVFTIGALGFQIQEGPGIPMYFVVGGWQMISVIAHLFVKKQYKVKLRMVYHMLLIVTMATGFLTAFGDGIIYYLFGLLFWSPVLAIMYVVCCYMEVKKLSQITALAALEAERRRQL